MERGSAVALAFDFGDATRGFLSFACAFDLAGEDELPGVVSGICTVKRRWPPLAATEQVIRCSRTRGGGHVLKSASVPKSVLGVPINNKKIMID